MITQPDQLLRTIQSARGPHAAGDDRVRAARTFFRPGTPMNGHVVAFQQEQVAEAPPGADPRVHRLVIRARS
jgi:hypothetical protein